MGIVRHKPTVRKPSGKPPDLRVALATAEFEPYAQAVIAGRFSEAIEPRNRLLKLGFEIYWRPRPKTKGGVA